MGRRVPGSPRRRRVENPNRRDGHACPSPGDPSAPLGLRPAPPAGQVPSPPSRPGRARGPPREPRAHGTAPPPLPQVRHPGAWRAGGGTSETRASARPRAAPEVPRAGAGPRASRQQPPASEATAAGLEALSCGPAPPGRAAPPRPGRAATCPSGGAGVGGPRRWEQVRGRGRS